MKALKLADDQSLIDILYDIKFYKDKKYMRDDSLLALLWDTMKLENGKIGINQVIATVTDEAAFRWYEKNKVV